MSSPQQEVAEARRAVHALADAVERLTRSHPDTVDLRRLAEDVGRVRVDLDLVAGGEPSASGSGHGPARDTVRDLGYDPREFVDGTYEGTTGHRL